MSQSGKRYPLIFALAGSGLAVAGLVAIMTADTFDPVFMGIELIGLGMFVVVMACLAEPGA
jgi:hypothetical protein